jgi:hypothetical protein
MSDLDTMNCVKCNSTMEEGAMLGSTDLVSSKITFAPTVLGLKRIPVRTFRCTVCGYLEFYAR